MQKLLHNKVNCSIYHNKYMIYTNNLMAQLARTQYFIHPKSRPNLCSIYIIVRLWLFESTYNPNITTNLRTIILIHYPITKN